MSKWLNCRIHFARATTATILDSIELRGRLAKLRHRYRNLPAMAVASSTPLGPSISPGLYRRDSDIREQ